MSLHSGIPPRHAWTGRNAAHSCEKGRVTTLQIQVTDQRGCHDGVPCKGCVMSDEQEQDL